MEEEVTVVALCEVDSIFLRPGILYRFEVMDDCPDCKALNVYEKE
jgi:hypothetical protein